jgi:hypothetical protein
MRQVKNSARRFPASQRRPALNRALSPRRIEVRDPKDMTRMISGLLAFCLEGSNYMIEPKTRFEQVPLEVVEKILQRRIRQESLAVKAQAEKITEKLRANKSEGRG